MHRIVTVSIVSVSSQTEINMSTRRPGDSLFPNLREANEENKLAGNLQETILRLQSALQAVTVRAQFERVKSLALLQHPIAFVFDETFNGVQ